MYKSEKYDCDGELIAVSFEGDGLFPAVEGAGEEDSAASVVPGEFGQDVDILGDGLVV